jgi:hypothetical protein
MTNHRSSRPRSKRAPGASAPRTGWNSRQTASEGFVPVSADLARARWRSLQAHRCLCEALNPLQERALAAISLSPLQDQLYPGQRTVHFYAKAARAVARLADAAQRSWGYESAGEVVQDWHAMLSWAGSDLTALKAWLSDVRPVPPSVQNEAGSGGGQNEPNSGEGPAASSASMQNEAGQGEGPNEPTARDDADRLSPAKQNEAGSGEGRNEPKVRDAPGAFSPSVQNEANRGPRPSKGIWRRRVVPPPPPRAPASGPPYPLEMPPRLPPEPDEPLIRERLLVDVRQGKDFSPPRLTPRQMFGV